MGLKALKGHFKNGQKNFNLRKNSVDAQFDCKVHLQAIVSSHSLQLASFLFLSVDVDTNNIAHT